MGPTAQINTTTYRYNASHAAAIVVDLVGGPYPFVRIWHRVNAGPWWYLERRHQSESGEWRASGRIFWLRSGSSTAGTATPPVSNPAFQQTDLTALAVGPATVTSRKLYRTAANQAQLKLLTTLANNTATTYTDAAADATLGANAPTSETSGLVQTSGQINPGATAIPVASTTFALPTGGWAIAGNGLLVKYTGISGNQLTGIPASGAGALTAALTYGSTISAAPMLTGRGRARAHAHYRATSSTWSSAWTAAMRRASCKRNTAGGGCAKSGCRIAACRLRNVACGRSRRSRRGRSTCTRSTTPAPIYSPSRGS